jgi:hypothetical protein
MGTEAAVMQQSTDKGQTAHGSDLHLLRVMYGGSVGHDEGGQRQDVSGRKELSQHSSPASPRLLF